MCREGQLLQIAKNSSLNFPSERGKIKTLKRCAHLLSGIWFVAQAEVRCVLAPLSLMVAKSLLGPGKESARADWLVWGGGLTIRVPLDDLGFIVPLKGEM